MANHTYTLARIPADLRPNEWHLVELHTGHGDRLYARWLASNNERTILEEYAERELDDTRTLLVIHFDAAFDDGAARTTPTPESSDAPLP